MKKVKKKSSNVAGPVERALRAYLDSRKKIIKKDVEANTPDSVTVSSGSARHSTASDEQRPTFDRKKKDEVAKEVFEEDSGLRR